MSDLTDRQKALHAWMLSKGRRISKCLQETMTEFRLIGACDYPGNVHLI